ncbi:helix-turn-helix domain-containing protein [Klebsiella pasteurii]|uniref:HTH araC/xylS-type domain-containing protein n=1 Tax=Klebsiella pasteurii TaxID=2587529 RepID=A0ABT5CNM3_9ENTR|nr:MULTISPECIES: helix-turn-helix domain-containing protein [Klebsiella]MCW9515515.1 hypothetical protein [Klebsiella michiganensis]MCW9586427.1 hypothetical protein [Klebsiella pasteurii]MDC0691737.1 hypothetical protein [Klebsiella pasteurii]MDC0757025.1 hypothetical protein [Klebsiella pasteurii]MDH0313778.1 hypothetical protein [Klebsiella pasteurii]
MTLACQHIAGGVCLTQTAERVGYQSQAAFNRAFQRITGVPPAVTANSAGTTPPFSNFTARIISR